MSKDVQQLGHDADVANQFTGLERQLTVDKSNWELRLHDGVTPGGHRILNLDQLIQLFQARSLELDGLEGWEPNQKGFVVRLGTASYALRRITVNGNQLEIVNPGGYDGNVLIGIAGTITTPHTASNTWTFTQEIQAEGGLRGDVIGNLTGNVLGDIVGNVVGNVTGNLTGDVEGGITLVGTADFSNGDIIFADGQIPLQALGDDAIQYIIRAGLPVGSIVPFAGVVPDDIPENWFICDGTNATPDLRERFIMGASVDFEPGDTGGSNQFTGSFTIEPGGAHAHTGEVGAHALTVDEIPSHSHYNGVVDKDDVLFNHGGVPAVPTKSKSIDGNSSAGIREGITTSVGGGDPHTHELTTEEGGEHTHTLSASESLEILPPFMALVYIMKGS